MMGRQDRDQRQLFYEFSLDEIIPTDQLLRHPDHQLGIDRGPADVAVKHL